MNHSEICGTTTQEETICVAIERFAGDRRKRWNDTQLLPEPRTILLVEDEELVREVASEVLRTAGYRVLSATNAGEALQFYYEADHDIDLLVTDVILPGENGRALAEKLRRENPLLPVLLETGYAEQMVRETGEQCLAKPFSSEDLLGRVRELMDNAPLRTAAVSGRHAAACGLEDVSWNVV